MKKLKPLSPRSVAAKKSPRHAAEDPPERDTSTGEPTKYFRHLRSIVSKAAERSAKSVSIVLDLRVSTSKQLSHKNEEHQLRSIERMISRLEKRYGVTIEVLETFREGHVSAWRLRKSERPELVKAAEFARQKDAILVALNTSRFVRNKDYWRHHTLPTVDDFEKFMALVGKVQVATILHPDIQEDRPGDTKRGHKARDAKPGRPRTKKPGDKKRRRMRFKLPIIRLCKQGLNNYEIARQLDLPEKTVRDWRNRYRKYLGASFLELGCPKTSSLHGKTRSILKNR